MAQITQAELLARVKKALNIGGSYQDDTLDLYIDEVKAYLHDAGVHDALIGSTVCVGVICRGVSDLWNYGAGQAELSSYFQQRAIQLASASDDDISREFYTLEEILVYVQNNIVFPPNIIPTELCMYPDGAGIIQGGLLTLSDGSTIDIQDECPEELTLTSTANGNIGETIVTVSPALTEGNHYRIKSQVGTTLATPALNTDVTDWEAWDGESIINATGNYRLVVAECDADDHVLKTGWIKVAARVF